MSNHNQSIIFAGMLIVSVNSAAFATPREADALLLKADRATNSGDFRKYIEQAIKLDPTSGNAYCALGYSKYIREDYDGALKAFKKAIELKPKDTWRKRSAYNFTYHCYIKKQNWKSALDTSLECFKISRSPEVANDIALLYKHVGDQRLAREYQQQAADMQRLELASRHERLEQFRKARNPETVEAVLKDVNQKLSIDENNESALSLRITCYVTMEEYKKAIVDLNKMIAQEPTRGALYARRGSIYKSMGDMKNYIADNKKAKENGFDVERFERAVKQRTVELGTLQQGINPGGALESTPANKSTHVRN